MRGVAKRYGPFLLYDTVVGDWRQTFHRDHAHREAHRKLASVLEESSSSAPLTRDDVRQLMQAFTHSHDAGNLIQLVRYSRETLGDALDASHYQSLLRVLAFARDKIGIVQTLTSAFENGSESQELYARSLDALHVLSPKDGRRRMLDIVRDVHATCGGLVSACGEEAAAADAGEQRLSSSSSTKALSAPSLRSPVLSSLLHHCAHDIAYPSYLPLVIAVWIKAMGAELTDWDYLNCICALAAKPQSFPVTRRCCAQLAIGPPATASLERVIAQVKQRAEPNAAANELISLIEDLAASQPWYSVIVTIPVMNWCTYSLSSTIDVILDRCARTDASLENPFPLFHATALALCQLGDTAGAMGVFVQAVHLLQQRNQHDVVRGLGQRHHLISGVPVPSDDLAPPPAASRTLSPAFLMDIGQELNQCSERLLREVVEPFTVAAQAIASSATDTEVSTAGAQGLTLMQTDAEAEQAWQHIMATTDTQTAHVPHSVRILVKKFVDFCSRHPPRNPKYTSKGAEDREKWGNYLEARDAALTLFGSGRHAKDAMRHFFYNKGRQPALRSAPMIEKDVADCCALLGLPTEKYLLVDAHQPRLTQPILRRPYSTSTPSYLTDPSIANPYPHIRLPLQACSAARHPNGAVQVDYFPQVWNALMGGTGIGAGQWFLKDPEMYILLLRCLVYRADWEAAVQLTTRCVSYFEFTYLMDHQVQHMFDDIGDPNGALAFKAAAKLYDGRIQVESLAARKETFRAKMEEAMDFAVDK